MLRESTSSLNDEMDLFEVVQIIWRGRWWLGLCTLVAISIGVAYALTAREWYSAEAVLMQSKSGSMSEGLSQLGGLASLAGIRISGDSSSAMPVAVLRSRDFANEFVEARDVASTLVAAGALSANSARPEKIFPANRTSDAVGYFREHILQVNEDQKTGLITVAIRWTDPALTADWANDFVARLNARLRSQAISEAEGNIEFLRNSLAEASMPVLQQSIGRVLETEMQKLLLAKGGGEYAFKVVDAAVVPTERFSPRRGLIVALALVFGLAIGSVGVLLLRIVTVRRDPLQVTGS